MYSLYWVQEFLGKEIFSWLIEEFQPKKNVIFYFFPFLLLIVMGEFIWFPLLHRCHALICSLKESDLFKVVYGVSGLNFRLYVSIPLMFN